MADIGLPFDGARPISRLTRLLSNPDVQRRVARLPLIRRIVRREGEAMFDLIAGFCQSQVLLALVKLSILDRLSSGALALPALARGASVPENRMEVLLRAGEAIGLLKYRRGVYRLTTRGAALVGVPGLQEMIAHHDVLYRDLADPVAFFQGNSETELSQFWPYVFGAGAAQNPEVVQRYSNLMADSQTLVAEDTLAVLPLGGVQNLLDVGGGSGAFLAALGAAQNRAHLHLFDLPAVVPAAHHRMASAGLSARFTAHPGSFRDQSLPKVADMITLVRVLYDHADDTVDALLASVKQALPVGGRIVISEPMLGADRPTVAGDVYFALYCMAMQTGKARSAAEIAARLQAAGFASVTIHQPRRAFVTTVIEAVNPD